jgi:hypothetical protein
MRRAGADGAEGAALDAVFAEVFAGAFDVEVGCADGLVSFGRINSADTATTANRTTPMMTNGR